MEKPSKTLMILGALAMWSILIAGAAHAMNELPLPPEVISGTTHLLSLAGPGNREAFHVQRIAGLMDFVARTKNEGVHYVAESHNGFSSSYNEVDVRIRLAEALQYAFNPVIPWFASSPSSLRSSAWKQTDSPWTNLPHLWELLGKGGDPVVIRGRETVENTPDTFSGGYYRYDLHRTLIVFSSGSRRTVISISKQADVSEVGRKGYIVGNDEDWNYFYSGETGLNVTGLGWVKSYMYDSAGISVYTEAGQDQASVRAASFKWLRAGWSKINMVKNEHIQAGMGRFARAFKEIMESPRRPPVNVFENDCRKIAGLSDSAMREQMQSYRQMLAERAEKLEGGASRHLPEAFRSDSYWQEMKREEMQSTLVLETLKARLGKAPASQRALTFLPSTQAPRQGG
jgi:hypothetical protein